MIHFSGRNIDNLDEAALKSFLDKKFKEGRFLDYKQEYGRNDDAKKKFLEDITGLANAYGGNIIVGVTEIKEKGGARPDELKGIENGPNEVADYRNRCDDSIDPRISGIRIEPVALENGKWAIVIYVPPSLRRPHMVTYKGANRFHVRREDRTLPMTTDEVKRTVIEVINQEKDIESYIHMIEDEIVKDFIGDDFALVMHAVPYLLEEDCVDTSSKEIREILRDDSVNNIKVLSVPSPTLYGVMGEGDSQLYMTYIHRNGYVGAVTNLKKCNNHITQRKQVDEWIKKLLTDFLQMVKLVNEKGRLSLPFQIRFVFENAAGAKYFRQDIHACRGKEYTRNRIKLPGIRIDDFDDATVAEAVDKVFERLVNAFGVNYTKQVP